MSRAVGVRSRALVLFLTLAVALMGVPFQGTPAAAVSPSIVISQVYGGGGNSSATYQNDFVELFNRGLSDQSVTGWSVQYSTNANSAAWTVLATLSGSIPAGGYYLVKESGSTANGAPLPAADASGTTNMNGTNAKVALVTSATPVSGACPTSAALDIVGYGTNSVVCAEGSAVGALSNTTAAIRNNHGCVDTDNNSSDFVRATPSPRNSSTTAAPCSGVNVSVSVVGSGSVMSVPSGIDCPSACAATFTFGTSVTLTATPSAGGASEFAGWTGSCSGTASCVLTDSGTVTAVFAPAALTPIHDIQGAGHISPLLGQQVKTSGVVTAKRSGGYYIQDPAPDTNDATSEGIFIFGDTTLAVGDAVQVVGTVNEFSFGPTQLSTTEVQQSLVSKSGTGTVAPTVVGTGGRIPPTTIIENDASGSENTTNASFDPAQDGMDFYESLEGMVVQLDNAITTSRTDPRFGELWVIGDSGANAAVLTPRGGIVITDPDGIPDDADFNPERIMVDDEVFKTGTDPSCAPLATGSDMPCVNVGATFTTPLVGVMDYDFSTYRIQLLAKPTVAANPLARESTVPQGPGELAVATFNVQNLAPSDPDSKYTRLAGIIVNNLAAPDIVALEEIQDNSGATDNGVVAADVTLNKLISFITAAGGPSYQFRSIDPVNDQDGGAPGGNIRVGYIFRTDRGLAFVDRPGASSTTANAVVGTGTATHLLYSPGRIDPNEPNGAWLSSRKPLAAEWTYNGHRLFTIANHFNSKLGDESLYGVDQPPQRSSEVQRHKQAPIVNDFVKQLETADPSADVVVLGDLNDFQFSDTLALLKGSELHTLIDTLPANEQYTYVFEGNSQAIDHTLLSNHAFASVPWQYDVVHLNSEFADNASDHEPQVTRLYLPDRVAPTVTPPADSSAEATSSGGARVDYGACTATDDSTPQSALVFDYSIATNETFPLGTTEIECGATDASGNRGTATFHVTVVDTTKPAITGTATPAANLAGWNNGPVTVHFACSDFFLVSCSADTTLTADGAGQSVTGAATDSSKNSASLTVGGINIDRTAPTVTYTGNAGTYTVDQTIGITCSASDALSGLASNTCANIGGPAYAFLGTNTYHASATDVAGNSTTATATFTVGVTSDSLCALAKQLVTNAGVTGALCQKLANVQAAQLRGDLGAASNIIDAFKLQIDAQTGKTISATAADLLKRLAGAL
jgi:uncharacterized protein